MLATMTLHVICMGLLSKHYFLQKLHLQRVSEVAVVIFILSTRRVKLREVRWFNRAGV